ncbi:tetratricopeptide repeat protein [Streptomyces sp. ISL-96]|uniref:tetratricopeptide repeat protein n=1 Tax=Streptomyces sp. ISL-96 TaxID=2819191 RepID=UPI001BE781B2|nr:tetratricopeptide repeat protein [Streptomyces sp. ISL-96]MBT2491246.1 tetratricopeptide repeat protein [Streptomyces sp. ISL-96]
METEQQVKRQRPRVAVLTGTAVLAAGVAVVLASGWLSEEAPAPGPVGRAMAAVEAVGAGVPASAADLTALIGDRESWLRAHPEDDHSWAVLGSAYLERGRWTADPTDFPRAEMALRHSLSVRPGKSGNPDALVGLAALAHARGDHRAAKKWGEAVRKRSPKRWTAYPVLIGAYTRLGDQIAAAEALKKLEALHPGPSVRRLAAEVYRDRGWREDAAATLADATARAGSAAEKVTGLHLMGELAWERGEPEEALSHYGAALGTDPGYTRAQAGRARVLASLGLTADAERDYQTALALTPLPELHLEYGELLQSLGREAQAQEQYTLVREGVALRQRRGGGGNELLLGQLDADHGDPATAVRRLRAEWRRHPNPHVADALAWALFRSGEKRTEALKYARKATDYGLRNAQFFYHLGAIEQDVREYGAARRHLEEALRINPAFSPLLAPKAREALNALGEPLGGGPRR